MSNSTSGPILSCIFTYLEFSPLLSIRLVMSRFAMKCPCPLGTIPCLIGLPGIPTQILSRVQWNCTTTWDATIPMSFPSCVPWESYGHPWDCTIKGGHCNPNVLSRPTSHGNPRDIHGIVQPTCYTTIPISFPVPCPMAVLGTSMALYHQRGALQSQCYFASHVPWKSYGTSMGLYHKRGTLQSQCPFPSHVPWES